MPTRFLRNALVLGLISAIGPFAIDMYLPALPSIGLDLRADTGQVQLSLMAFFAAVGVCQLAYGPLSDMFGRKLPLYFGLALFALGGIGCSLADDIDTLIGFRFVQGVGACAGMVVPRAIVRDLHTGPDAAQLMSLLMLVFSVSPILAPLTGSAVIALSSWRGIFWVVAGAGLVGLVLVATLLRETRPPERRVDSTVAGALSAYGRLLGDRGFLGLVFIGAFGMSSFFTYLANSSFVLIEHYGLTPALYSVTFSVNAVGFIGAAQLNGWLARRFGLRRIVRRAVACYAAVMLLLLAATLAGIDDLAVLIAMMFVGFGFLGLVIPTTAVLALDKHGPIAGTASALMGTLQLATGSAVILVVGLVFDGTARPMVAGIAGCAAVAFVLAQLTLGGRQAVAVPAE